MIRIHYITGYIYTNYSSYISYWRNYEIFSVRNYIRHKVVYLTVMTPPFVDHSMHNTCYITVYVLLLQHRENEHAEISMIFTFVQFHETFYVTPKRKYSSHTNSKSNLILVRF